MSEFSFPWSGVAPASGEDAGRYQNTHWFAAWTAMHDAGGVITSSPLLRTPLSQTNIGVYYGIGSWLAVSSSGNNKITVATGMWINDGGNGYNDTEVTDIAITSPAANPRIDRVVVRKNYTGNTYTPTNAPAKTVGPYTARITIISGSEAASPTAPSLIQDTARNASGTFGIDGTWDIPLAQYQISTGGIISNLTDEREYVNVETKRFFIQAVSGYNVTDGTSIVIVGENTATQPALILPDNKISAAFGRGIVPRDFIASMSIESVLYSPASGNILTNTSWGLGGCGQARTTHTGGGGNSAIPVTLNVYSCINEEALTNVEFGDFISIESQRIGNNAADTINDLVRFQGWLVEYLGWK